MAGRLRRDLKVALRMLCQDCWFHRPDLSWRGARPLRS
jgi:hypothetical protein